MVTWLDGRMIGLFIVSFLLFCILPWVWPVFTWSLPGKEIVISFTELPRIWVMNSVVLPLLPADMAVNLANWWQQASYIEEVVFHITIAINLYIPIALVQFGIQDAFLRLSNWYQVRRFELGTKSSKMS